MKLAITSFVCSLVSLVIFWWLGIVGVFLGVTAVCRCEGDLNDKNLITGFSVAGIVIGAIGVVLYLFILATLRGV